MNFESRVLRSGDPGGECCLSPVKTVIVGALPTAIAGPAGLVLALVSLLEVARSFLVRHQAGRSRVGIGSSTLARRFGVYFRPVAFDLLHHSLHTVRILMLQGSSTNGGFIAWTVASSRRTQEPAPPHSCSGHHGGLY